LIREGLYLEKADDHSEDHSHHMDTVHGVPDLYECFFLARVGGRGGEFGRPGSVEAREPDHIYDYAGAHHYHDLGYALLDTNL
jgi:hypothetical protein